ncbi:hypothetical protein [Halorubrum sp. DTA46]|uniref:hypothetical protein n=1 Tax=Halorubrum sp. DTA46 TaxID=3402162 RepID=UPI003AAFCD61
MTTDSTSTPVLHRLRTALSSPEHTGENRCLPCTIVNAIGVAVVVGLLSRRRRSLGLLAGLLGAGAIWLRGYVVPGTPRFAPRIVGPLPIDIGPDRPDDLGSGSLAGNADAAGRTAVPPDPPGADAGIAPESGPDGSAGDDGPVDPETVMRTLVDAGALADDGEQLVLDESFRAAVYDRIEALRRESNEALADRAAALAGQNVEGEVHDGRILLAGGRDTWLSRSIALAETAFAEALRERGVDDAVARGAARPLRAFLDACPACDGPVRETTLRNCCGGPGGVSGDPERPVRACADCDAVVFADRP